ncbi:MAG TPA: ROK family protein [Rhizomicrobium sp.]
MKKKKKVVHRPIAKRILGIDVGATGIKVGIIDAKGAFIIPKIRIKTPHPCPPRVLIDTLLEMIAKFPKYDHIAVGFPGYVRDGKVVTAPNLGTKDWAGFPLAATLARKLGKPARLANDADMQGLAVIKGNGLEFVITLGTGFGTAWFRDAQLLPHMELAHLPIHREGDYDEYIGDATRKKIGNKDWIKRVEKTIAVMKVVFNYDHLYIGGGNARHLKSKLPPYVSVVSNDAGMEGGAWLWNPR